MQPTRPCTGRVVESLPVHEAIKKGRLTRTGYIENYKQSLQNLAACGIQTVCYNFMPVLDWSRTDLSYEMPDGSRALRFVWEDFALFDLCILKRPGAVADYEPEVMASARQKFSKLSPEQIAALTNTILLGLPGFQRSLSARYLSGITKRIRGHWRCRTSGKSVLFCSAGGSDCSGSGYQPVHSPR